jgi:hypothetical protein
MKLIKILIQGNQSAHPRAGKACAEKNSVASDCSKVVLDVEHHLTDLGKKFAQIKILQLKSYVCTHIFRTLWWQTGNHAPHNDLQSAEVYAVS